MGQRHPECPRCGYDLSGLVASWTDSCPLSGECSECGLGVWWPEVVNPRLTVPSWSFEHTYTRLARRLLWTLARALWPMRFWRQLRMEHPICWRRLFILPLCMAVVAHFLLGITTAALAAWSMSIGSSWRLNGWPIQSSSWAWTGLGPPYTIDVEVLVGEAIWPYTNPLFSLGPWLSVFVLWTLFTPASYLLLRTTFRQRHVLRRHLIRGLVYSVTPAISLLVVWYVLSTATYLADEANPTTTIGSLLNMLSSALMPFVQSEPALLGLFGCVLACTWLSITRHYLRLPHAPAVAAAMVIASGLLAFLITLMLAWDKLGRHLI